VKLLLDTHIWIWLALEPEKLTGTVRRALQKPEVELWLSSISLWELVILVEKGRVQLEHEVGRWIQDTLKAVPMHEAPLTHDIVLESRRITLPHRDPVDRFLVATARVLELKLVTADERLLKSGAVPMVANR